MPQQTIASLCKAASLALRKAGLAKEDGNEADQRAHLQKFMSLVSDSILEHPSYGKMKDSPEVAKLVGPDLKEARAAFFAIHTPAREEGGGPLSPAKSPGGKGKENKKGGGGGGDSSEEVRHTTQPWTSQIKSRSLAVPPTANEGARACRRTVCNSYARCRPQRGQAPGRRPLRPLPPPPPGRLPA
mmetsp:Transcript_62691/g.198516  ORF Transcript_62691/g.198516 Transcript_62691/m.198516 type:complete len:186 (-) Transcript_62691:285-842(-)